MGEVEKNIHNLKPQYNREVNKVTKSKVAGADTSDLYELK
jgi:hypothetical protein